MTMQGTTENAGNGGLAARRADRPEREDTEIAIRLDATAGNPLTELAAAPAAAPAAVVSTDHYGAFSIEKFASASDLSYTHEDAQGWLNYVNQFDPANFWYRDAGVAAWAYYEEYDNWQDTYGMDAVRAVYHSGHGNMDANGVFYAAMGANWGGLGTNAVSSSMKLGNEQVRYLFWSTCFSLRVLGAHNPIRTWYNANGGWRMLFGYETTSIDAGNYGSAFFNQWNRNKSFSQAFLDASWYDVSRFQAPAVTACGASPAEAQNRLYNERLFYWDPVSRDYWHWRWYNAATSALASRAPSQKLPQRVMRAQLAPQPVDGRAVRAIVSRLGAPVSVPSAISANARGGIVIGEVERNVVVDRNGTYEGRFGSPNLDSSNELQLGEAVRKARESVRQLGLDRNDIVFDRVFYKYDQAGSTVGSGEIHPPRLCETVVQFAQRIDGVPVVGPGEGIVSITLDNDQNVTHVVDRTRSVARLIEAGSAPREAEAAPGAAEPSGSRASDPEALLAAAWQAKLKGWILGGKMPTAYAVVPGSFEVGYAIRDNSAVLVARQEIEADCGGGFLKRFAVEVPIVG